MQNLDKTKIDIAEEIMRDDGIGKGRKIALVANSAWYIANFRMSLIKALENEGFEVLVIAPIDDFVNAIQNQESVKFIALKNLLRKSVNFIKDYRLYKEIYQIYQQQKPDLVLHYTIKPNIYGTQAARRLGIPSLVVIPGLGYTFSREGLMKSIVERIYRYVLPYNEKVLFENKSDKDYFVDKNILKGNKAIALKGCGIDLKHFHHLKKNKNGGSRKFLFMGRLIKEKGIYEFIEAAKIVYEKNKKSQFWIIGHIDADNPSAIPTDTFLGWIQHPAIKYLGFIDDVRQVIRNVDCVVLPSYYPEGVPRVLQEGMAMRKPIITADYKGCREAVDEGENGYLVEPRDSNSLADAMIKICNASEQELVEMGAKGRAKAEKEFDEHISTSIYLSLIEQAINSKQ